MSQETEETGIKTEYYYYNEEGERVEDPSEGIRFWARKYRTDTGDLLDEWHGFPDENMPKGVVDHANGENT